jgi:O-antigen ligase
MTPLRDWSERTAAALATVLFAALIVSMFRVEPLPLAVPIALVGFAVFAALKPDAALIGLALIIPFVAWLGRHLNGTVSWPETVVVAFAAGYCARGVRPRTNAGDVLDPPIFVAIGLVAASLAVQFLIDAWRFGGAATRADLLEVLQSKYFLLATSFDPIDAAMRLIESLILLRAAATLCRENRRTAQRLIAAAVAGASAAAVLNLTRVWDGAMRLGTSATAGFVRILMNERLNVHYGDLNAAGSYFVMAFFAAIGLVFWPLGWPWLVSVLLIGSSIWVTGSRTAVIAGMLALALPAGARAWRLRHSGVRGTTVVAAALVLGLLSAVAAYSIPERGNQQSAGSAAHVRWELAKTSFRMTAQSPAFGVGIGRFYARSGEFSSPELLRAFPPAVHENAHNNFLQILAELGLVGLIVVVWLLVSGGRLIARLLQENPHDPLRWSVVTGLLAFVISWLGGHPLLIDEPAFSFWLLFGAAAGWGANLDNVTPGRLSKIAGGALGLAILISIPVRVDRQKADFNLEHRGVGLSAWHDAIDGVRYRVGGATSSVFVPSDVQMVSIPLRAIKTAPQLRVELRLDGRPADVVNIFSDRWQLLRLRLPQDRNAPRFRRLDLHVVGASSGSDLLMIGKVEPR